MFSNFEHGAIPIIIFVCVISQIEAQFIEDGQQATTLFDVLQLDLNPSHSEVASKFESKNESRIVSAMHYNASDSSEFASSITSTPATVLNSTMSPEHVTDESSSEIVLLSPTNIVGTSPTIKNVTTTYSNATSPSPPSSATSSTPLAPQESTTPVHLVVEVVGNTDIELPVDSVVLHAKVNGIMNKDGFAYKWTLISHPIDYQGEEITHGNTLTLKTLTAGSFQYQVQVTSQVLLTHAYGEAFVNITVMKPARVNSSPRAMISPQNQEITLPHENAILDASASTDDDRIASYLWEMTGKPLQADDQPWSDNTQRVLELKGLVAGKYEFKLTVTDTDGATNSTTASVTVNKKIDHKPIADAGDNLLIHLPRNSVVLYANNSRDDYGILSYEWVLSPDSANQVVDMQGTRTSELHLSNLKAGDYKFRLTVADKEGQQDSDEVMVNVQPESNLPPQARAGDDNQVFLNGGDLSVKLDGSKSSDDKQIKMVKWAQKSGPVETKISSPNSLVTSVSGLNSPGNYVFALTVGDAEGETSSNDVTVIVNEVQPPVADAGPDVTLVNPDDVVVLDGGNSHDDYGIKSYSWSRDSASPASGRVVNGSDSNRRMIVEGLTAGSYKFTLTVTNIRGKSASDDVILRVKRDPYLRSLVELHLGVPAAEFTEGQKKMVAQKIPLLLSLLGDEKVVVQSVFPQHRNGHLVLLFFVQNSDGTRMEAVNVVTLLNTKLRSGVPLFEADVMLVDTFVCENNCSGHGFCHSGSKLCECETFWMQNFIRYYVGDGTSNCDWSVLYFVIVCFILAAVLVALIYGFILFCFRKRKKGRRVRRRRKNYTALVEGKKQPKNGFVKNGIRKTNTYRSSSLMRDMTSSSDEDETLYEKQKLIKFDSSKNRLKREKTRLLDVETAPTMSGTEFDGTGLDKTSVTLPRNSEDEIL